MKKTTLLYLLVALALALTAAAQAEGVEFVLDASSGRITGYNGSGGDIAIPAEIDGTRVWNIKGAIFQNNEAVTGISLPDGMDVLDENVTSQLPGLTSIRLPESLRVISRGNIQLCASLTSVTVPAGVCYIADNCFSWCEKLTDITFTGVCPVIADYSFSVLAEGCVVHVPDDQLDAYRAALPEELTVEASGHSAQIVEYATPEEEFAFDPATGTVTGYRDRLACMDIPAEIGGVPVKAIGEGAFTPAYHLQVLNVPEGVEVIGKGAFANTNSIQYVRLPDSVREIGDEAFLGAIRGSRFHWPAELETIGEKAFYNCNFTDDLEFTPALKSIGASAFESAWPKNLHLPEGCEPWIGARAFDHSGLDYMQLDSYGFFDMAPDAFAGSRLDSVDLPWDSDWENRLAWQAYFDAQELEDVTVYINNPPDCDYEDGGRYEKGADGYFYLTSYEGDQEAPYLYYNIWDNSSEERVLIQCHGVGDGVFKGNQTIRRFRVTHANWEQSIGAEAFADSSVELVDLFYTTRSIGAGAFRNCVNLKELTLPASLESIGEGAFDGCDRLAKVTLLCDPAILPENAFANCAALMADPSGLILPADASDEQVARLSAEMGCPWYAPLLRQGEEPRALSPMPFEPTDPSLFEFDAETGTITGYLGGEADVVVPARIDGVDVTAIGYNAFESCRDYTDTDTVSNRTQWTPLRSVVLPETVTAIADSAFSCCQQLETFVCYGPVESTGRGTFRYCRSLDTVVFVNGVKMIDNYCFDNAGRLSAFYSAVPLDAIGESAFVGSGVENFVADAARIGNRAFMNCESLSELHLTGRVAETDGGVVYNCPKLSELCLETGDLSAYSRDGFISNCADSLHVRIPEDADDAAYSRAQSCITWGTQSVVSVARAACEREEAACPDIAAILAGYAANPVATPKPVATPEPIVAQPVGEAGAPYLGAWVTSEVTLEGVTYQASDLGMNASIVLNADGTAVMVDVDSETETVPWAVTDAGAALAGMVFRLTEDGRLMAEQEGFIMTLDRADQAAEPEPATEPEPTPEPATEPEPTAEPATEPEPVSEPQSAGSEPAFMDVKLVCVAAESSGYAVDPEALGGEYAVTFHGDGSVSLVIADAELPELAWTRDGDNLVVDFYGQGALRFTPAGSGCTLDYFGAMTLSFEP